MEQLKTTNSVTSGIAIRPIAEVPRAGSILLGCLNGIEVMSTLLTELRQDAVGRTERRNSAASKLQVLLGKRFGRIKQFFSTHGEALFLRPAGLTKTARPGKPRNKSCAKSCEGTAGRPGQVDDQQALLERIDLLERKLADAEIPIPRESDWVPLVKLSAAPVAASPAELARGRDTSGGQQDDSPCAGLDLSGRCVLCVGGRAALYPEYRRLVETTGGNLLIYRSSPQNDGNQLPALLSRADMVVCPVDCVNHHTYFSVKRYCKYSGKPCILLDRSGLPTFRKGVATLAALVAPPAGSGKAIRSSKSPPTA